MARADCEGATAEAVAWPAEAARLGARLRDDPSRLGWWIVFGQDANRNFGFGCGRSGRLADTGLIAGAQRKRRKALGAQSGELFLLR